MIMRALAMRVGLLIGGFLKLFSHIRCPPQHKQQRAFFMMSSNAKKKARRMLSLSGYSPICKLVEPGRCQFTDEWISCKLMERLDVSSTSSLLRFGPLPNKDAPLNLSTCACILAKADLPTPAKDEEMEAVVRPYTPVSTNDSVGFFDLLVKNYGKNGRMSRHLCEMNIGEEVEFKHIPFNVKIQAPFKQKKIVMLVGGTGITPMIQALHAILGDDANSAEVTMLYGSKVSSDILGYELLQEWTNQFPGKLKVTHVLSDEPEDSTWRGKKGYITKEMLAEELPNPSDKDSIIFVCGPPAMYKALCGPRDENKLTGVLADLGYEDSQVFKF